jgi:uncharacterized delta-60 repeat protein
MRVMKRIGVGLVLVCVALAFGVAAALARPVRVDPGFGVDGIARTAFPPQVEVEPFREIAAAPDGGVVTRSSYYEGTEFRHYGPDGALGKVEADVKNGDQLELQPPEAAIPEGGRLVGVHTGGEDRDAVSRYLPDGSLDTSFGSAGTSEKLPFEIQALAPLPSGRVLVAGKGVDVPGGARTLPTYQVVVARLGSNGKIEAGFGQEGIAKLHGEDGVEGNTALHVQGRAGESAEVVTSKVVVALDPSGKLDPDFGEKGVVTLPGSAVGAATAPGEALLVAGAKAPGSSAKSREAGPNAFFVARYTAAGKLDTTFAGGTGLAAIEPGGETAASAALFGSDGTLYIGGLITPGSANCPPGYSCGATPAVVRFTPEGLPDDGFGQGGIVRLSKFAVPLQTEFSDGVEALAARSGGGVFASGTGLGATFVAALGANGSPAAGFGAGGFVTKAKSKRSYVRPEATGVDWAGDVFALIQTDGGTGLGTGAAVLRYTPEGKLDQAFGEGGIAYVASAAEQLAVAPDGSSFVVSSRTSTLSKFTPSGSPDPSFGTGGTAALPAGEVFEPVAVDLLPDGDIILGGGLITRGGPWSAVFRLLPDGRLDPTFGNDGMRMAKPPGARAREETTETSMAVDQRGRILLAGGRLEGCCTENGMVVRFDANGRLDRSFGHDGFVQVGGRKSTEFRALGVRGGQVFGLATSGYGKKFRVLLYSFRSAGRPESHFGNDGIAVVKPWGGHGDTYESVAVFSTPRRILLARTGTHNPLVAFSSRGTLERGFPRRPKRLFQRRPKYSEPMGAPAILDGSDLLFAWSNYPVGHTEQGKQSELSLQRVLLR